MTKKEKTLFEKIAQALNEAGITDTAKDITDYLKDKTQIPEK